MPSPALDYQTVFETLPGAFLILTGELNIAAASRGYLNAISGKTSNLKEKNIFDFFRESNCEGIPALQDSFNLALSQQLPNGIILEDYFSAHITNGQPRYYDIMNSPVYDEAGKLLYLIHQVTDVTEQKRSEQKFFKLLEAAPDATVLVNDAGNIYLVNHQTELLLGYQREELIGRPMEMLIPNQLGKQHSEHREAFTWSSSVRVMRQMSNLCVARKNGNIVPADISLTPIHSNEGLMYSVSIRDISASKKIEEQLKLLSLQINQSTDAIFVVDIERKIKAWNPGAEKLYGYSAEEAIGKYSETLLQTFATGQQIDEVVATINRQGYWSGETKRKAKSGREIYVHTSNTIIRDNNAVITGYISVSQDITEKKRLRKQVAHLATLVEHSVEAIISRGMDKKLVSWNKGAEKIFGYSKEEALGKTARELGIIKFTDKEIEELEKSVFETGTWKAEKPHYRKNGTSFIGSITSNAVKNEKGEVVTIFSIVNDISDRIQLEEMLRKNNEILEGKVQQRTEDIIRNEKKYRNIFENNPMPIWVLSLDDFSFLDVNEMAILKYGYSREEFLSMTAVDIRPHEEKDRFIQSDHSFKNKSKTASYNKGIWKHRKKDGTVFITEIISHPIIFEGKRAKLILANDVTDKKLAEEKLVASENRFRALIDHSHDIIALLDSSYKLVYRSPSATRITGWTDEDMMGMDGTLNIHPDDRERSILVTKEIMANPGKEVFCRFRNVHKNGSTLWLEGVVVNLLNDENVRAIVFNFRDITARVEAEEKLIASEERFRHSFDNMLEGVQIVGFDWRHIYVNDAMARHGKYLKEELIGHTVMEQYPGIEHTAIFKTYQRCFTERISIHLENEFEFPDKSKKWFELSFQPVPEGIFILSVDITDRKKAEQKILQSEENLKAIFDNASEGFILLDKSGNIKTYNAKVKENIARNVNKEIHAGINILDIIQESEKEHFKNTLAKVFGGQIVEYDRAYNRDSGEQVWINFLFSPVIKNELVDAVCITSRDITREKTATQEIEFNSNNLKALINNTKDMLWSVDLDLRLITSNDAFDEMAKMRTGTVIQIGSEILSKDFVTEELLRYRNYYERAFAGEAFRVIEHTDDPVNIWAEISFNPIHEGNKVIGTACFSHDITERKKAEEKLNKSFTEKQALAERMASIINTIPANIALLNEQGVIVDTNKAWNSFARHNGYHGINYCIGQNYITVSESATGKDESEGKFVAQGISDVLANKIQEFVHEYSCNSAEKKRWFRMVANPLLGKKKSGAVVMHMDISELRRLEQERLKNKINEQKNITLAMLQAQEKERNYIGRELHDNVNQILVGTKLYLELAANKNDLVKDLIKYPVELIDSSIAEMRSLSKKLVTPLKNIDLKDLLLDLMSNMNKAAKINTHFTYNVQDEIHSDDLKLNIYRIIQEQVNNILKYAEAQNVVIHIKQMGKYLKVEVSDDGRGFDVSKKRNGIGISNMINRAESFNGRIQIKSSIGKGCKTTVTLPC